MISDAIFIMGTLEHCRKTVELQTEPMFLYVFDHYNPSIMGELAAGMPIQDSTHTCELFYLFKKGLFGNPELTETEQRVMDIYSTAISNFAKYGDPNGSNDVNSDLPLRWNPITRENLPQNYVITSDQPKMSNDLFEGRTAAFIDIRNRHK
ncbi:hypothetical protein PRIPAC_73483 [Pristionchus pacificus]|nr:hypothetical protein PRIPAC_73483 [Pristionchus pacificus]